jgi:hypothetical protein
MDRSLSASINTQWVHHVDFAKWLVLHKQPELIVDLGTFHGASAFALGTQGIGKLVTIDREIDPKTRNLLKAHLKNVEVVEGLFSDVVSNYKDHSIDILHFDGDHKFPSVIEDLKNWVPKLKDDGVVLMHDVFHPTFWGPLVGFIKAIDGCAKLIFPEGCGLGVASRDVDLMGKISTSFFNEIIPHGVLENLIRYVARKNLWIKAMSDDRFKDQLVQELDERSDILSCIVLNQGPEHPEIKIDGMS